MIFDENFTCFTTDGGKDMLGEMNEGLHLCQRPEKMILVLHLRLGEIDFLQKIPQRTFSTQ